MLSKKTQDLSRGRKERSREGKKKEKKLLHHERMPTIRYYFSYF